jgi:flavorubredoxin
MLEYNFQHKGDYMEKINDTVTFVGCEDQGLDLFESQYKVPHGVSYNSYLIDDGKTVLMDTVDKRKTEDWIGNVQKALNGKPLDYLVVQHLEPDHSASIDRILALHPEAKVIASAKAWQMLGNFIDTEIDGERKIAVKTGDTLELPNRTLHFVAAPMVHWPEVIMTYDDGDKILFSADGFGKFGTRDANEPWDEEARRYYINIVGKYGRQVQAVLKAAAALDIQTIAPLHGPVLSENLEHYIHKYDQWSKYEPEEDGVFIAVASIHGNTLAAAHVMNDLLKARGLKTELMDLTRQDVHEAVANCYKYSKVLLIACSYDAGVFPPMERMLSILKHKAWQKRTVGLIENGSWAPSAAKTMKGLIEGCADLTLLEPVVTIKTRLKESDLPALNALADELAK